MNYAGTQTVVKLQGSDLVTGFVQDCTPILDDAKARHNQGFHGSSELKHVARIPLFVVEKYLHDNGITFEEYAQSPEHKMRVLNNPDNAGFRIWTGRL